MEICPKKVIANFLEHLRTDKCIFQIILLQKLCFNIKFCVLCLVLPYFVSLLAGCTTTVTRQPLDRDREGLRVGHGHVGWRMRRRAFDKNFCPDNDGCNGIVHYALIHAVIRFTKAVNGQFAIVNAVTIPR